LHTGSVFVRADSTKVIDPEFAFYGPMGYDVGNVVSNLIFARINSQFTMPVGLEKETYIKWLEVTITDIIDLFSAKFLSAWEVKVTDIMAKEEGFNHWYLDTVLEDTAAVAGLELIRRIIGLAKVKDITSIANTEDRATAERICLEIAKTFIMKRQNYKTGKDFLETLRIAIAVSAHK
jgi:5-methylthioribose kinase